MLQCAGGKRGDSRFEAPQILGLRLTMPCRLDQGEFDVVAFKQIDQSKRVPPRHVRAVALPKPTETERHQWYVQRHGAQLPSAGNMLLFDRSWYNRAGVERVMGFCTPGQVKQFLAEAPEFEASLVRDGIRLFKLWLTVGHAMQVKRLHDRRHDPLKSWKLSPIDLQSMSKWDEYTQAREDMFDCTHTKTAPWTVIRSNDKRRARLNAMRHILASIDYSEKDKNIVAKPDPEILGSEGDIFKEA